MNAHRKVLMGKPPVVSYQELLAMDERPSPSFFARTTLDLGTDPIPASNYTSPEYFEREKHKMWFRTWQYAVGEDEIPNSGDTYVYELLGQQVIVVRQMARSGRSRTSAAIAVANWLGNRPARPVFAAPITG